MRAVLAFAGLLLLVGACGGAMFPRPPLVQATRATLVMRPGEVVFNPGHSITFVRVVSDSRCPIAVQCIQAGDVVASFRVTASRTIADVDLWLSIGLKEGDAAVADTRKLCDTLTEMRRGDRSRLTYYEDPDGAHSEACWARQIRMALVHRVIPSP